jgi:hypothetical protein
MLVNDASKAKIRGNSQLRVVKNQAAQTAKKSHLDQVKDYVSISNSDPTKTKVGILSEIRQSIAREVVKRDASPATKHSGGTVADWLIDYAAKTLKDPTHKNMKNLKKAFKVFCD